MNISVQFIAINLVSHPRKGVGNCFTGGKKRARNNWVDRERINARYWRSCFDQQRGERLYQALFIVNIFTNTVEGLYKPRVIYRGALTAYVYTLSNWRMPWLMTTHAVNGFGARVRFGISRVPQLIANYHSF